MNSGTELTAGKTTARRWIARTVGALVAVAGVGLLGAGPGFAAGGTLAVTSVYSDTTVADHTEGIGYGPLWGASSVPIATFTDSDACPTTCQPATDYKARVLWGDGSATTICAAPFTAACTISASATAGTYNITATHAFVDEKSGGVTPAGFTIHVVVDDIIDAAGTGATGNNGAASGLMVTDQASGQSSPAFPGFTVAAGTAYTGPIGSFHDGNQDVIATDVGPTSKPEYTFSINWGDGTALDTTTGSFTIDQINCGSAPGLGAGQGCPITVNGGPHTYATAGPYTATTAVKDGANAALTVTGAATVTSNSNANCATATLAPTDPTVATGASQVFTATSTVCTAPLYQFWLQYPATTGTWHVVQPFGTGTTWTWDTTTSPYNTPGAYRIVVWANQTGHSQSTFEAFGSTYPTLATAGSCTTATTTLLPNNPTLATGASQVFTATSTVCAAPKFQFWLQYPATTGPWTVVQPFSVGTPTWTWNTGTAPYNKPGNYRIIVWANQTGHPQSTFEGFASTSPILTGCGAAPVTFIPVSPSTVGTPVAATGHTSVCGAPKFEFWILAPGTSTWVDAQSYAIGSATFNWVTTGKAKGVYHFSVWVRDANSGGVAGNSLGTWDSYVAATYTLT